MAEALSGHAMSTVSQPTDYSVDYPDKLEIQPRPWRSEAVIDVPGSKSITNRALILAALAEGSSRLLGALDADDTRVMIESLRRLGITARWETPNNHAEDGLGEETAGTDLAVNAARKAAKRSEPGAATSIYVEGQGGVVPVPQANLFLGNSGTSIRFLTALCALGSGPYRLDGVERMRQRPQGDLLEALNSLGVEASSLAANGCPPLEIRSETGLSGGIVRMHAEASSQFLTALLMVAPYASETIHIDIIGDLRPLYVEITRQMMAQWGVATRCEGSKRFSVEAGQRYAAQPTYTIEPDASSASYFFGAAALTGGSVTVRGLHTNALQGDVRFATEVLALMGCRVSDTAEGLQVTGPKNGKLHGVSRDMSAISDTSLTLAALAPFANTPTTIHNIAHARLQECDRIAALCAELTRLGVRVEEHADGCTIYPAASLLPATVQTYNDHRVAMSFALIGLKSPGVVIDNPGCVAKTFPAFWQTLDQLC